MVTSFSPVTSIRLFEYFFIFVFDFISYFLFCYIARDIKFIFFLTLVFLFCVWFLTLTECSPLLVDKHFTTSTYKSMHKLVIESSVRTQRGNYFAHCSTDTSKRAKVYAVMSAKTTNDALQLTFVKCSIFSTTPPIQIALYDVRRIPHQIEVLPAAAACVDGHPVTTWEVR